MLIERFSDRELKSQNQSSHVVKKGRRKKKKIGRKNIKRSKKRRNKGKR